jgi:multicomponent Na+:H+ antiporter subunit D
MHIATHAFGKITLFFCAGAILVATHKTEVSQMRGLGRRMPITMTAFLIAALSIIGLPPAGGTWSKWHLAIGTLEAGQLALLAVLMISSLLNIAYLLPIPLRAFFSAPSSDHAPGGVREAPLPCLAAIVVTAVGCLALFFYPEPLYRLASQVGR